MEPIDPYTLIGKKVPAADGGDYGHLIVGYDERADDLLVVQIVWLLQLCKLPHGSKRTSKTFYREK